MNKYFESLKLIASGRIFKMSYYDTDNIRFLNGVYGMKIEKEIKKPHFTNVDDSNISEIRNVLSDYITHKLPDMSCKQIIELVSDCVDFTLDYYYLKNELIKELYFAYIMKCELNLLIPKTGWLR